MRASRGARARKQRRTPSLIRFALVRALRYHNRMATDSGSPFHTAYYGQKLDEPRPFMRRRHPFQGPAILPKLNTLIKSLTKSSCLPGLTLPSLQHSTPIPLDTYPLDFDIAYNQHLTSLFDANPPGRHAQTYGSWKASFGYALITDEQTTRRPAHRYALHGFRLLNHRLPIEALARTQPDRSKRCCPTAPRRLAPKLTSSFTAPK